MNSISKFGLVLLVGAVLGATSQYIFHGENNTEKSAIIGHDSNLRAPNSDNSLASWTTPTATASPQLIENPRSIERLQQTDETLSNKADTVNNAMKLVTKNNTPEEIVNERRPTQQQLQNYELVKSRLIEPGMHLDAILTLPETQALPQELKDKIVGDAIGMINRGELDPASFLPGYKRPRR